MKSNKNITISGDILFVNKIYFLSTISFNINFTTIKLIFNRDMKQIVSLMVTIMSIYTKSMVYINNALMDGKFEPI